MGFVALVVALGGVAYAAIPSGSGVFTGCYATTDGVALVRHSKGDLRLVEPNEACRQYEKKVTWNKEGQPGAPGEDGVDGVSGYEVVVGDVETLDPLDNNRRSIFPSASCPEGKKALGGGWRLAGSTAPTPTYVIQNNTIDLSSNRTWVVGITEGHDTTLGGTISFRAFVTCAIVN